MAENMTSLSRFNTSTPSGFGMRQVLIVNLLSIVPAGIAGALLGAGGVGLPGTIILAAAVGGIYWIVLIPLCCLVSSLVMFLFVPGLMFANYYIKSFVSHLQPNDEEGHYICQMSTQPRSCTGLRALLEDADDVGVLSIQPDAIEFRGDHSDFAIALSSNVNVELRNIGWRGFWFASLRVVILIPDYEDIQEIHIAERQSWTVVQSTQLARHIYEAIRDNLRKT